MATVHPSRADRWPRALRVWTAECRWCLDELQRRHKLPRNLTHPHDRYIRTDAGIAAEGFSDPGNLALDDVVHVLVLWKYVSPTHLSAVLRISPAEYGQGRNKSAVGSVNLRGNIIEALTLSFQRLASESESYRPWGSTGGASSSRPSSAGAASRSSHRDWSWR